MEYAQILNRFLALKKYVEQENFAGWDPYDGLNSKIFQSTPLRQSRLARLAWIQFFKKSPFNLRRLTLVEKGHNSKGLALFLSGYVILQRHRPDESNLQKINYLVDQIIETQNRSYSGSCWGYNFDWQARAFFQPKNTPTIVATSYVANALLDAYDFLKDARLLKIARSACNFILKDINRTQGDGGGFCFSYSPLDHTQIYNASLLGSKLLLRVYSHTKEIALKEVALQSAQYCCAAQKENGSWSYGTLPFHFWIDNFHTGFNLECLYDIIKYSGDKTLTPFLERGLDFYLKNFFTDKGESKFYNDCLFPIDIHAPAQLMIVSYRLGIIEANRNLIKKVIDWTIVNMQDKNGYFYYQVKSSMSSKIPYMRWGQAWMFYSLSIYLSVFENEQPQKN